MYVSAGSRTNHSPGTRATTCSSSARSTRGASRSSASRIEPARGQQHVLGDLGECARRLLGRPEPCVLEVEGRAVVDQPHLLMPDEQVRVGGGAVDVGDQGIEPDDVGCELGVGLHGPARGVRERAGQEVDGDVEPAACEDQLLDLGIRLGTPEDGVEVKQRDLRHPEAEGAGELADDDLSDERERALPRAAELQHVQPVVVGLDQPRHRSALAQRRHVAGRRDLGQGGRRLHRAHPSVVRRPA